MSETQKTPGGAADLIEDAIAEYEVERIGGLSPDELRDEMRREKRNPERADAILRRALAVVAETPDTAPGGSEQGAGASGGSSAGGEPPRKVVNLAQARANRRRLTTGSLLVLAAMLLLWIGRRYRDDGVAGGAPDRRPEAAELRKEAVRLCREGQFAECEARLDRAFRLEPEGEGDPDVTRARAAIRANKRLAVDAGGAAP
jgi:hypothetical protein